MSYIKPFLNHLSNLAQDSTQVPEQDHEIHFTGQHSQITTMCIKPNQNIGLEVHNDAEQQVIVLSGCGLAILSKTTFDLKCLKHYKIIKGSIVMVPMGYNHDFVNTSNCDDLILLVTYSPPIH